MNASINGYSRPFAKATLGVVEMIMGECPLLGEIETSDSCSTNAAVNVVISVTGEAEGAFILGLSLESAIDIATAMVGSKVSSLTPLAVSAIAELANMIAGNAVKLISDCGATCDIAPPMVIQGSEVEICTGGISAVVMPFETCHGTLWATVSIATSNRAAA